jgi:hypothetical protein
VVQHYYLNERYYFLSFTLRHQFYILFPIAAHIFRFISAALINNYTIPHLILINLIVARVLSSFLTLNRILRRLLRKSGLSRVSLVGSFIGVLQLRLLVTYNPK